MTRIKPDGILMSSLVESFTNYDTKSSTITISGSVGAGATSNFSTTIDVGRSNTIADIYAENQNTGKKMLLNAGAKHHPYQYVSSESTSVSLSYSGSTITVTFSVFNGTAGSISLTSQVMTITAVLYDVPY